MKKYKPEEFESRWQKKWDEAGLYRAIDDLKEPKKYILDMFPYPSGDGLHVGHCKGYVATDILSRYYRMRGFNVLHPMGWDAFGLPAENYALKTGVHPKVSTAKNIANIKRQMQMVGLSYDWEREINTTDPGYYKWTQWIFVKLFEAGLAYEAEAPINWCPSCKTGLANEEVLSGECERCGSPVEQKKIRQWMLGITKYADKLVDGLADLDWPKSIKEMQINWIGRAEDTEINFVLKDSDVKIKIITTRPDTIFGATFLVLAPEHELIKELRDKIRNWDKVQDYVSRASLISDLQRGMIKEKTGVKLEGVVAVNPVNKKEIPVYTADFVLATYGTGAIMGVPGHDDRDFAFAKRFNLPIVEVVKRLEKEDVLRLYIYDDDLSEVARSLRNLGEAAEYWTPRQRQYNISLEDAPKAAEILEKSGIGEAEQRVWIKQGEAFALEMKPVSIDFGMVYSGDGVHVNSEFLNGLYIEEAKEKILEWLVENDIGRKAVHYHLRDWIFSRQRYWGEPIPIVHCEHCGAVAVPEEDLPVELPEVEAYQPTGTGESPLAVIEDWVKTTCPKCSGPAKRETNTMPQWAGSCWYYLRFIDPDNKTQLVDKDLERYWMGKQGVDWYVGGAEHAVLHLLYARFWHKFLFDIGDVSTTEPFYKLTNVGLVLAPDGRKMSKRWGNVVTPDDVVKEYGVDTLRVYEAFMGPFESTIFWDPASISGVWRFLNRVWEIVGKQSVEASDKKVEVALNKLISKASRDIEGMKFNTAVAGMMEFINLVYQQNLTLEQKRKLLLILAPFAPHMAEELWKVLRCHLFEPDGSQSRRPELVSGSRDSSAKPQNDKNWSVHQQSWPKFDEKLARDEKVVIVVQVNGRVRDKIEVSLGMDKEELEKLAKDRKKVQELLEGKRVKQVVVVSDRLVNFVV